MAKKPTESNSLEAVLADINKQFGAGTVVRLDESSIQPVNVLSTGVLPLDIALGVGGLPFGRIVEFFGPPSSGKSTLALHVIAEAQKNGLVCAYIDAEHALDPVYAKAIGVHLDELLMSQPNNAEQGLETAIRLISSGHISVVVIDSVAALVPRAEIEGEMGDHHVGLQPRLIGQALRKMTGVASDNEVLVVFINQLRESIGKLYGPTEYTPGGKALPYYSSVRLDVRRIQTLKTGEEATGNRTRVKVVKNKVAAPYRQAEFDLVYGIGVPKTGALIDCAVDFGIIKKSGSWLTYQGEQLGQGKLKARNFIDSHPGMYETIYSEVVALAGGPLADVIMGAEEDVEA